MIGFVGVKRESDLVGESCDMRCESVTFRDCKLKVVSVEHGQLWGVVTSAVFVVDVISICFSFISPVAAYVQTNSSGPLTALFLFNGSCSYLMVLVLI